MIRFSCKVLQCESLKDDLIFAIKCGAMLQQSGRVELSSDIQLHFTIGGHECWAVKQRLNMPHSWTTA